jgi:hypothetical protein
MMLQSQGVRLIVLRHLNERNWQGQMGQRSILRTWGQTLNVIMTVESADYDLHTAAV